jgi:DNA recombination protein RmuC
VELPCATGSQNVLPVDSLLIALGTAVVTALIVWFLANSRQAALLERLRSRDDEAARLNAELAAARTRLAEIQNEKSKIENELAGERASAAERIKALTEAHERLTSEFKALSADALKNNNAAFLELARATLEKFQEGAKGDLAARQQAIDSLVKPLKESLDKVDVKIGALENARKEAYGSLTEQLKGLATAQTSLQSETTKLSRSLRSTSTAGRWGEIQLRRVVELSGMLENVDFHEQKAIGEFRPDMTINLPGGKSIAVDSKAPIQAYLEALESSDETIRKAKFLEHARAVRGHIDALGNKAYWQAIQPSPEFVVLFIPGEAFYSTALHYDPGLFERGSAVGVILASPATLIALLKAAAYGWKQETLSKNTEEIRKLGLELHERVAAVAKNLDDLGQRLTQTVEAYNRTVYQTESQVLVTGRKLEKLGAGSEKKIIEARLVDEQPKQLTAPELKS